MNRPPINPLALLAALTDHVGQWGPMATDLQWDDARAVLDVDGPRRHWIGRAKGYSKSRDMAAVGIVGLLTQFPVPSDQRGYVAASDSEQATLIRQSIQAFVSGTPELKDQILVEGRKVTALQRGTELHILSADVAGAHGIRPCLLLADEVANWPNTPGYEDLFGYLWAGLVKTGGRGVIISTAGSPTHWSRRIFEQAQTDPMWRVSDTHGPPPWTDPAEVESARRMETPARFSRLFMNVWAEADDALVTTEDLAAAACLEGPIPPKPGVRYVVTLDTGLVKDRTVVVVAHLEDVDGRPCVIVDFLCRWAGRKGHPVDLDEVEEAIVDLHKHYPGVIRIDEARADQILQRLIKRQLPIRKFGFTTSSVGILASALLRALRSRTLHLPRDQVLLDELASVKIIENSAGVPRLGHSSSGHDDHAVALALAVNELVNERGPFEMVFAGDDEPVALDGQPLQQLNGAFAMLPTDSFESALIQAQQEVDR